VTSSCTSSVFTGFRFPREVTAVAVCWYLRYGLSCRDVEELLAERGVTVDHVTIRPWAKLLMMLEAAGSIALAALVIARTINILQ
jgi:transposase-like protein